MLLGPPHTQVRGREAKTFPRQPPTPMKGSPRWEHGYRSLWVLSSKELRK